MGYFEDYAKAKARLDHAQARLTFYCKTEPNTAMAFGAGMEWNDAKREMDRLLGAKAARVARLTSAEEFEPWELDENGNFTV